MFQTQIMFLMGFYTDVLGISALAAGNIFLFSRLWDAIVLFFTNLISGD